jgi:hypothetical protein
MIASAAEAVVHVNVYCAWTLILVLLRMFPPLIVIDVGVGALWVCVVNIAKGS